MADQSINLDKGAITRWLEPGRNLHIRILRLVNSTRFVAFCFGSNSSNRTFVPGFPRIRPTHSVRLLSTVATPSILCTTKPADSPDSDDGELGITFVIRTVRVLASKSSATPIPTAL